MGRDHAKLLNDAITEAIKCGRSWAAKHIAVDPAGAVQGVVEGAKYTMPNELPAKWLPVYQLSQILTTVADHFDCSALLSSIEAFDTTIRTSGGAKHSDGTASDLGSDDEVDSVDMEESAVIATSASAAEKSG